MPEQDLTRHLLAKAARGRPDTRPRQPRPPFRHRPTGRSRNRRPVSDKGPLALRERGTCVRDGRTATGTLALSGGRGVPVEGSAETKQGSPVPTAGAGSPQAFQGPPPSLQARVSVAAPPAPAVGCPAGANPRGAAGEADARRGRARGPASAPPPGVGPAPRGALRSARSPPLLRPRVVSR